ncbi:hypothetical protein ACHAPT_001309 [Fusarium lateritium]
MDDDDSLSRQLASKLQLGELEEYEAMSQQDREPASESVLAVRAVRQEIAALASGVSTHTDLLRELDQNPSGSLTIGDHTQDSSSKKDPVVEAAGDAPKPTPAPVQDNDDDDLYRDDQVTFHQKSNRKASSRGKTLKSADLDHARRVAAEARRREPLSNLPVETNNPRRRVLCSIAQSGGASGAVRRSAARRSAPITIHQDSDAEEILDEQEDLISFESTVTFRPRSSRQEPSLSETPSLRSSTPSLRLSSSSLRPGTTSLRSSTSSPGLAGSSTHPGPSGPLCPRTSRPEATHIRSGTSSLRSQTSRPELSRLETSSLRPANSSPRAESPGPLRSRPSQPELSLPETSSLRSGTSYLRPRYSETENSLPETTSLRSSTSSLRLPSSSSRPESSGTLRLRPSRSEASSLRLRPSEPQFSRVEASSPRSGTTPLRSEADPSIRPETTYSLHSETTSLRPDTSSLDPETDSSIRPEAARSLRAEASGSLLPRLSRYGLSGSRISSAGSGTNSFGSELGGSLRPWASSIHPESSESPYSRSSRPELSLLETSRFIRSTASGSLRPQLPQPETSSLRAGNSSLRPEISRSLRPTPFGSLRSETSRSTRPETSSPRSMAPGSRRSQPSCSPRPEPFDVPRPDDSLRCDLPTSLPDKENVNCHTCGNDDEDALVRCPCGHCYCHECLGQIIETSVDADSSGFPPACCDKPVPVDVNSTALNDGLLEAFMKKKLGFPAEKVNRAARTLPPAAEGTGASCGVRGFYKSLRNKAPGP